MTGRGFVAFMFIDELEIFVQAGHGGAGCVSFRREKYVELGGPNGGSGGSGGSVIIRARLDFNTLLPLRNRKHYRADKGQRGGGSNMTGASGKDLILEVPCGTVVRDRESNGLVGDLTRDGEQIVVAAGGRGGKGNKHFASSTNRAPRYAQQGERGESLWLRLELKMVADVGLVGFPNAGKSTLISRVSAARPKVADYPFTTLTPNLGVVSAGRFDSFLIADIPGIIEGAHQGAGLGLRFLRHIERTTLLLLLIDPADPEKDSADTFAILCNELSSFSPKLARKDMVVAFTKADLPLSPEREGALAALRRNLDAGKVAHHRTSAVRGDGIRELVYDLFERIKRARLEHPQPLEDAGPQPDRPSSDPLDEV